MKVADYIGSWISIDDETFFMPLENCDHRAVRGIFQVEIEDVGVSIVEIEVPFDLVKRWIEESTE